MRYTTETINQARARAHEFWREAKRSYEKGNEIRKRYKDGLDIPSDTADIIEGHFDKAEEYAHKAKLIEDELPQRRHPAEGLDRGYAEMPYDEKQTELTSEGKEAWDAYIRKGVDELLYKTTTLNTVVSPEGGWLMPDPMSDRIITVMKEISPLRSICTVMNTDGPELEMLVDRDDLSYGWVGERQSRPETEAPEFEKVMVPVNEIYCMPKATQNVLDDANIDLEAWLATKIGEKFAQVEGQAFISGNSVKQPQGILMDGLLVPETDHQWGKIAYRATGADAAFSSPDDLIDMVYSLKAQYRTNGRWLMNSATAGVIRKMKDDQGRFLWEQSMQSGQPSRLAGYPVTIAEDMPDIASDAFAIGFGDFRQAYTIVDRQDISLLRDPYTAKPNVLFYTTKRVGGGYANYEAVKFLKFGAS